MKHLFFILLLVAALAPPTTAGQGKGEVTALFAQASAAQAEGRHEQAVRQYMQIIREHGISAPLLANLAASHAAAGQIGQAVLNYERALRLAPGDAGISAELARLRSEAGLHQEKPLHERAVRLLAADQWLLLSGAAFAFFSLAMLAAGFAGGRRSSKFHLFSCLLLAAAMLPLPPALLRYQTWRDGVVTAANAQLLISPFAGAEAVSSLKAGSAVHPLRKEHVGYELVRDESGQSGWLEQSSFELISKLPQAWQEKR